METTASPQPSADTAPPDPAADRVAALDLFLGETEVQRVGQEILSLRRLSELALREAERLDQASEARAARLETAEARLAAAPVAERPTDTDADTDTDTDEDAEEDVDADADADAVESLQPTGETSLALYRLTRVVRLNILLEHKLIADFRAPKTPAPPKPEAAPKPRDKTAPEPSRWAKFGESAELSRGKAVARELTRDSAEADERLDREDVEALMAELEEELASGRHDKTLLKEWGNDVGQKFLKGHGIKPDYRAMCARTQAAMVVATWGPDPDGTPIPNPAEPDAPEAVPAGPAGQDGSEAATAPAASPQPGDTGSAAETPPPDIAVSGTGPP
jgi:hypothetical protein